jgi:hypothetical protein
MCMQCMAGAATAVGAASGTRAYLASRHFGWLTARRLRLLTVALAVAALAASATLLSGSSAATKTPPGQAPSSQADSPAQR